VSLSSTSCVDAACLWVDTSRHEWTQPAFASLSSCEGTAAPDGVGCKQAAAAGGQTVTLSSTVQVDTSRLCSVVKLLANWPLGKALINCVKGLQLQLGKDKLQQELTRL